ncbi:hypothetical protein [Nostoc cycadae]|uniref:hypothetical protein n=1 Tax=Nostoc cycadae TaxID=246795 RepID=UPI000CCC5A1B|nr:hypothetical protein [Nostoc cycadae]
MTVVFGRGCGVGFALGFGGDFVSRRGAESRRGSKAKQKLEQVNSVDSSLPVYIVIVEFSKPLCFVVNK